MTAIITEKFRLHNATQFFESFSEAAKSTYYMLIGKATPFTSATSGGTDSSPPTPADDVSSEFYVWDQTIAGKNIASTDTSFALPRRDWAASTTYDMYDDTISSSNTTTSGATNLYDSTFFFRTSENRVYKVIDNNGGTAYSGSEEPSDEGTALFAHGGYILKYMYKITSSEQTKFLTTDFMPVSTDGTVSAAATDGKIESLVVTAGSGYTNGTYYAAVYGDGSNAGTSSGAVIRITVSGNAIQSFGISAGVDTTVHAGGSGYTFGTVNLADAYIFTDATLSTSGSLGSGSGGSIRVIISPKDGHGANAVEELGGHYVMLNTLFIGAERDDLLTGNDFRNIAIAVDPTNFGTSTVATDATIRQTYALKLASTGLSGTFTPDEKITQTSTGAIGKVVEWDSSLRILYYQQERYGDFGTVASSGAYIAFSGANAVSGADSSASGTPDADADSAVTLANGNTITFTNGYANPELEPDSGNIIYNENRSPISRATDQTEDIKIIVEF